MPSKNKYTAIREFVENDINIIHTDTVIRHADELFFYKFIDEGVTGLIYGLPKESIDNALLSCLLYYAAPFNERKIVFVGEGEDYVNLMKNRLKVYYNKMRLGPTLIETNQNILNYHGAYGGVNCVNDILFIDYYSIYFDLNKFIHELDSDTVFILTVKNKDKLKEHSAIYRNIYSKLSKKLRDKGMLIVLNQI